MFNKVVSGFIMLNGVKFYKHFTFVFQVYHHIKIAGWVQKTNCFPLNMTTSRELVPSIVKKSCLHDDNMNFQLLKFIWYRDIYAESEFIMQVNIFTIKLVFINQYWYSYQDMFILI